MIKPGFAVFLIILEGFESCIEIKIKLNFYFLTSLWCLKRCLKGLHKAPQRSVKIKI